jgi:hypothetical protein
MGLQERAWIGHLCLYQFSFVCINTPGKIPESWKGPRRNLWRGFILTLAFGPKIMHPELLMPEKVKNNFNFY